MNEPMHLIYYSALCNHCGECLKFVPALTERVNPQGIIVIERWEVSAGFHALRHCDPGALLLENEVW